MTVTEATKIATEDGKAILEKAGFVDGIENDTVDAYGVDVMGKPSYYYTRSDSTRKDRNSILAIWAITAVTPVGKGDGKTLGEMIRLTVSFYTTQDRTSGIVIEALGKCEKEAIARGYEVTLSSSDTYDLVRRCTIVSYRLTKTAI